jgi:ubiquitin carboxyl-terminal hydrolase 9/24
MNDWCVAYVTEINESNKTITVYHDGWGRRTTTYPSRSSKLAPFRKNTLKYTGPRRGAMRDWEISEAELVYFQDHLSQLLSSNLSSSDAFFITQFLRGKLFIYIENLLLCNYKINKKFLHPVVNLFGNTVKLIVMWLKKAPELFPFYYKSLAQPDLYLEDANTALSLAWPELMDTLNKLFALDARVSDFFQTHDTVPEDYEPSPLSLMTDKKYSDTLMYIINLFTKEKGFEAVISILKEKDEQKRVPFPFVATNFLYILGQFFEKDFWTRFNQEMTSSILQRVDIISEAELKDLKHEDIIKVLSMVNEENLEVKKLSFYLRMLRCNYFEKRIKGLTEVNSVVESFEKKNELSKSRITRDEVKDWIISNNVLDLVINDRPHPELLKRSSVIIRFLAQNKSIGPSHLEMIWTSMQGKHDSYIRATYQAILDSTNYFSEDLHDFLYEKIKSVPLPAYDESFLNYVKDFTLLALNLGIRTSLYSRKEYKKEFGLEIFERLMQDTCPVESFIKISCKHIAAILAGPLMTKVRSGLVMKLLVLVSQNDSVPQSLGLIYRILKGIKDSKKIAGELKTLNESKNLIETVKQTFNFYLKITENNQAWEKVLYGRMSHSENLRLRLKFIEYIVNNSGNHIKLSQSLLEDLWTTLGQSRFFPERTLFFTWVTRGVKSKPLLDTENIEFLFKSAIMNDEKFPSTNMTEESFEFFKYVFILYHALHKNIEIQSGKFKFRRANHLQGFDKLVSIQLQSSEISEDVGKFIISLLLRHFTGLASQAGVLVEEFTDSLLSILLENKDNDSLVTRGLKLFKQLLDESEAKPFTPNSSCYIQEGNTREFFKVHYDQTLTVRHLRQEISRMFKKPLEGVSFLTSDKRFSSVDDDLKLKNFKLHCLSAEFKQPDFKEYNPLPAFAQNQKVMKSLFELLSCSDKTYLDVAWNLLVSLPVNQQLEAAFQGLDQPLNRLLDLKNMYRLLYQLRIIQKLMQDRKWKQKFLKNEGLEVLVDIFQDQDSPPLRQEALIRTFSQVLSPASFKGNVEKFVSSFFKSLAEISKISEDLKNIEELSESLEEIIQFLEENNTQELTSYFQANPVEMQELFNQLFFKSQNVLFRKRVREQLEKLSMVSGISSSFFDLLYQSRHQALKSSNENYWKLFSFIVKNLTKKEKSEERKTIVSELVTFVKNSESEKTGSSKNEILEGSLHLLTVSWMSSFEVTTELKDLFLNRGLFEIPDIFGQSLSCPPLCKHPETRSSAFKLVLEFCKTSPHFLSSLVKDLDKFHEEADWRGWRRADWLISANSKEKSQSGLVGLKNLGSTCYMNSMLQQIFMIESFRKGILAAECPVKEDSMLYQLQYLFSSLQFTVRQYVNTKPFAGTIKDYEGNPINVNEQMDVDEFFNYFMDKLEGWLKDSPSKNLIKNHFGGMQVTELIGKDCTHRSERYEPFLTVSVEVKNKKSLLEGLESFVAGEMLEGENAYQCDHCEAKVRAIRRVCLKHLPNFLIFALRRFEFDFETMNRVKLNDFCEFPLEIDLEPYTQEGLDRAEKEKERDKGINKEAIPRRFNDDYYHYKLRGIVIHAGTADCGHYYSYIQDKMKKWFEFNDVWVKDFDSADIPDECFGGEEKFSWSSFLTNTQNVGIREKCGNAYLLFYERTGTYQVRNNDEEVLETTSLFYENPQQTEHLDLIRKENQVYWRNKLVFAPEYSRFIKSLTEIEDMPFKFVTKFFLTIMIRTKEKREELVQVYEKLEEKLQKSSELSGWFVEMISVEGVCQELLLFAPLILMRKMILGLVKTAFKHADLSICEGAMLRMLKLLPISTKEFTRNFAQFHETLRYAVTSCESLISKYKVLNIIIKFLTRSRFKVPMSPDPVHKDIYLGYDIFTHPDVERQEMFYSEPRCCTLGHLFHLLWLFHEKIPKKYRDLLKTTEVYEDFLKQADNKIMLKYMARLYSELFQNDVQGTSNFIKKIVEFSHQQDSSRKHLYNKLFTPLLMKGSAEITRFFLTWKAKQLKSSRVFVDFEGNIVYLLGLCYRSREFQQVFRDHSDVCAVIEKWIKEQLAYSHGSSRIPSFEDNKGSVRNLSAKFNKVVKGDDLFTPGFKDSDDDLDEEKIQKGRIVEIYDSQTQQWVKATIRQRIGDLLYLTYRNSEGSDNSCLRDIYADEKSDCVMGLN